MISYGAAHVLWARTSCLSDEVTVYYCERCGNLAYKNNAKNTYHYSKCIRSVHIKRMKVPYAWKLLTQELMSMNIRPCLEVRESNQDNIKELDI